MPILIPVQYRALQYPCGIRPALREIAGHFDQPPLSIQVPFSLHTEYSYGARRWDSVLIQAFPRLIEA